MKTLAATLMGVLSPVMTPQKTLWGKICLDWQEIAGPEFRDTKPLKLKLQRSGMPGILEIGILHATQHSSKNSLTTHQSEGASPAIHRLNNSPERPPSSAFLLSYKSPLLIQRVNIYAGFEAIQKIRIRSKGPW